MIVKRTDLLRQIDAVIPGTTEKDTIQQSSCVAFLANRLVTFNEEVCCQVPTALDIRGCVKASPLANILRRMKDDEVDVVIEENKLMIQAKHKKAELFMEAEIQLPIDTIETVETYKPLPEKFVQAIKMVRQCASKDESQFVITCVNIHPNYVEALDNYRASRFVLETGFTEPVLIRSKSLGPILTMQPIEMAETEKWIHFRNKEGLIISCRRYPAKFPNLEPILAVEGSAVTLPKNLYETIARAEVFSSLAEKDNLIRVNLNEDKLTINGEGVYGKFTEKRKMEKAIEKEVTFKIAPSLLTELVSRHNECILSDTCLKIQVGEMAFVSVLSE